VGRGRQGLADGPYAGPRLVEPLEELGLSFDDYSDPTDFLNNTNIGWRFNTHAYEVARAALAERRSLAGDPFRWGEIIESAANATNTPIRWTPLTRAQRAAWWTAFGSSPNSPRVPAGRAFSVGELEELRAFWGTNDGRRLSPLELVFDGPEAVSEVLPDAEFPFANQDDPEVLNARLGPMRSWEDPTLARSFEEDRPTPAAVYWDHRRQPTTASGVDVITKFINA